MDKGADREGMRVAGSCADVQMGFVSGYAS